MRAVFVRRFGRLRQIEGGTHWRRVRQAGTFRIRDRLWNEWHGACTVHGLRVLGASRFPQALIEAHTWPGPREWIEAHEMFCRRLDPGEPDPPPRRQEVSVGRSLRHRIFGWGIVRDVLDEPNGRAAMEIAFAPRFGVRFVPLDAGLLRPMPLVARGGAFRWFVGGPNEAKGRR